MRYKHLSWIKVFLTLGCLFFLSQTSICAQGQSTNTWLLCFFSDLVPELCIAKNDNGFDLPPGICQKTSIISSSPLITHGLWPDFRSSSNAPAFPSFCTNEAYDFETLPLAIRKSLKQIYALFENLPKHEWLKHGTCFGTQEDYFAKLISYDHKLASSTSIVSDAIGRSVSYNDLLSAYGGPGHALFFCNEYDHTQYLEQIFTYWNKDGTALKLNHIKGTCRLDQPIHIRPLAQYLSLKDWEDRFEKNHPSPVNVGFDVDDTVLFSSPGFYYLLGSEHLSISDPSFWDKMNNGLDLYSLPKLIAQQLIAFHKKRKDKIVFITKRGKSKTEVLTSILKKTFGINDLPHVIFTDLEPKTKYIKRKKLHVYYGDSDADMVEAIKAGAQAIRIRRSQLSTNPSKTHNGAYGEIVLLHSGL